MITDHRLTMWSDLLGETVKDVEVRELDCDGTGECVKTVIRFKLESGYTFDFVANDYDAKRQYTYLEPCDMDKMVEELKYDGDEEIFTQQWTEESL